MANTGKQSVTLKINGKEHHLDVLPWVSLLDALRENLHFTGTKKAVIMGSAAHVRF
jgi:xanthine dehydrogenase YagT iron-sulfur-binding subunit